MRLTLRHHRPQYSPDIPDMRQRLRIPPETRNMQYTSKPRSLYPLRLADNLVKHHLSLRRYQRHQICFLIATTLQRPGRSLVMAATERCS